MNSMFLIMESPMTLHKTCNLQILEFDLKWRIISESIPMNTILVITTSLENGSSSLKILT